MELSSIVIALLMFMTLYGCFWLANRARMNNLKGYNDESQEYKSANLAELDFIDYDGMGNQGRFVIVRSDSKNRKRKG